MSNFNQSAIDAIAAAVAGPMDADAVYTDAHCTYGELYAMAAGIIHEFADRGPGIFLCVCTEDRALIAAAVLASLAGGPAVVVPHALSIQAVDELCRTIGIVDALTETDRPLPDGIRRVIPGSHTSWRAPVSPLDPEAVVLRLFTGGSTGRPRIWSKTAVNLIGEAWYQARAYAVTPGDRILATTPPYHIYGLLFSVLVPLITGASVIGETCTFPGEIIDASRRHKPTILVSVPVHYRVLCRSNLDPGIFRIAFSSAGPLDRDDSLDFHERTGTAIVEIYGSTETGGIATRVRARGEEHLTPLDVVRWRVRDGLLSVASPFISPELQRDAEGYYLSGDRITALDDGSFSLIGRADGIVKIGGKRIDLHEVRDRLAAFPGVRDAYVLMDTRGDRKRERMVALVEGESDGDVYRMSLAAVLEPQAVPSRIRSVERMPMTPAGKYDREAILRLFSASGEEDTP